MSTFGTKDNRLTGTARVLRGRGTDAEHRLWSKLRNRRFQNIKFRRQHPVGGYVLDFACEALRLAIELDGGQHALPHAAHADATRTEILRKQGWHILRFWNHELFENMDGVLMVIAHAIAEREAALFPSPKKC